MNQSEHIDQLATALAVAQGQIRNPSKNKKVKVKTRTGGAYEFEYADLTAIIDAIKKPLADNNIAYVQHMNIDQEGKFRLYTRLAHSSGQWMESVTPIFIEGEQGSQAFGSALTFMKRYALAAMLGIAADSDDDANMADGNEASFQPRKPKEPAPSPMEQPQAKPLTSTPHAIPVPQSAEHGEKDWLAWGKLFIDTAKAAETEAVADAWLVSNQRNLHDMLADAPKAFARLKAALAPVYTQLLLNDEGYGS